MKAFIQHLAGILTTSLLLAAFAHAQPRETVWVGFSDRGRWGLLTEAEVDAEARKHVSAEAIERRRVEGLPEDSLLTLADLPPDPGYVEAVIACGAELKRRSHWFNRVSVEATADVLERIRQLPFVEDITPVLQGRPAGFSYEIAGEWDGYPPPGPGADLPAEYGPSYLQNLMVNAVEAHRQGYTGEGVLVVVLDSGFELSHEAFRNLDVFAQYDFIEDDDYPGLEPLEDAGGQPNHGTACMSVIAGYAPGNLIGIAPRVTLILGKTEDVRREVVKEEDDFVAAMEWAERLGARVLSASLSYKDWYVVADYDGHTPFISRAANHARKLGLLPATSLGNEGPQPMTLGAPCDAPGVMGIGAVDSTGKIARFSSRGPSADGRIKPDLCAMGVRTACVSPQTEHRYSRWNGTSLSCPVIGGVLALVRGAHPEWSTDQVEEALKQTASQADHPDNVYGWGVPDVVAAIRYPEVEVEVLDRNGEPIAGAMVLLASPDADVAPRSITDEQGRVSFANLEQVRWEYAVSIEDRPQGVEMPLAGGEFFLPQGGDVLVDVE